MFNFAPRGYSAVKPEAILSRLMSAITGKLKFVVFPRSRSAFDVLLFPETLLASYSPYRVWTTTFLKMLLETLNKRWQTLDLKSMMSELHRSSSGFMVTEDNLSSVHRFKRKEDAGLS